MTHQSIPIYLPSMATTIEDWLTSLREGSRASHIQSQDTGPVKQTKEIYGLTQCELLGTWDRDFCFWRTCQLFLLPQKMGDQPTAEPWSGNFPSSGIAWNGMLYRRPTQGRPISANDGGLWPTPLGTVTNPRDDDLIRADGLRVYRRASGQSRGIDLATSVKCWSTPTAHEGQNQPAAALNPDWVEWLMGVPIGWSSPESLPEGAWEEWRTDMTAGTWWDTERDIPRVTTESPNRNKRLKALGNGIVPSALALFVEGSNIE